MSGPHHRPAVTDDRPGTDRADGRGFLSVTLAVAIALTSAMVAGCRETDASPASSTTYAPANDAYCKSLIDAIDPGDPNGPAAKKLIKEYNARCSQ
jgi:hypothetical protein